MAVGLCKVHNIQFVYWLQDIYSEAIRSILGTRWPIVGHLIGARYRRLEIRLLRSSDAIITISLSFSDVVAAWGVDRARIHCVPNWAPLADIPVRPKQNLWSVAHALDDKFCFLYAGTLGMKHNPDLLFQIALHFADRSEVRVVVLSEGIGAEWLLNQKAKKPLANLQILDYQPFEKVPEILGTADVLLGILEPSAGEYSVPSKVMTYLCAERPLLLALPRGNFAAETVSQNRAGIVVNPRDTRAFTQAAEMLYRDANERRRLASNGRAYAERAFNIQDIAKKFEAIFEACTKAKY
jgi:glycosyltransferase involved in cell wall biosynthesis